MKSNVFISIDCNNTGKIIESYLLRNDMLGLRKYNLKLNGVVDNISKEIEESGGIIYLSGGDNVLALIDFNYIRRVTAYIKKFVEPEILFSIGVGTDAVSAYLALKYAKALKVCSSVIYDNGEFIIEEY